MATTSQPAAAGCRKLGHCMYDTKYVDIHMDRFLLKQQDGSVHPPRWGLQLPSLSGLEASTLMLSIGHALQRDGPLSLSPPSPPPPAAGELLHFDDR